MTAVTHYGYQLATQGQSSPMCWNSEVGCSSAQVGLMIIVLVFIVVAIIGGTRGGGS